MMLSLTLIRPWDEPVCDGGKPVENRSWKPPDDVVGTYIAIHAGQKYSARDADWIEDVCNYVTLPAHESDRVRRMAVVGVARVAGWVHAHKESRRGVAHVEIYHWAGVDGERAVVAASSPWFCGPYGWLLDEAVAIAPVPCRGRQKLWNLPADVERVVRDRWEEARAG